MGKRCGGGTPGVPASRSSPGLILKRIDYPTGGGTGQGAVLGDGKDDDKNDILDSSSNNWIDHAVFQ